MKQTTEAEEFEAAKAEIAFQEKLSELKEKYKDFLTEDVIKHYTLKMKISRDDAILKLCANFENEANSVDAKSVAMKSMGAIRQMSPRLNGLVQREQDTLIRIKSLERRLDQKDKQIESLTEVIAKQNEILGSEVDKIASGLESVVEKIESQKEAKWTLSNILTVFQRKKRTSTSES